MDVWLAHVRTKLFFLDGTECLSGENSTFSRFVNGNVEVNVLLS